MTKKEGYDTYSLVDLSEIFELSHDEVKVLCEGYAIKIISVMSEEGLEQSIYYMSFLVLDWIIKNKLHAKLAFL
jgi:hypothetical protein